MANSKTFTLTPFRFGESQKFKGCWVLNYKAEGTSPLGRACIVNKALVVDIPNFYFLPYLHKECEVTVEEFNGTEVITHISLLHPEEQETLEV